MQFKKGMPQIHLYACLNNKLVTEIKVTIALCLHVMLHSKLRTVLSTKGISAINQVAIQAINMATIYHAIVNCDLKFIFTEKSWEGEQISAMHVLYVLQLTKSTCQDKQ